MGKKIAILTLYYQNYNYGGILQSYALQNAIDKMGFQAKQISYAHISGYKYNRNLKYKTRNFIINIYNWIKYPSSMKVHSVLVEGFKDFACKIPHTEVVKSSNISSLVNQFDCFICGSDQIWNPIGWQPTFFLDFVPANKKKIAYAASIARDNLTEEQFAFIKKYIKDYSAISVREKNSAIMLKNKYPELNVEHMPDPVFLLNKEEWECLAKRDNQPEKFIFAYFLGTDNENREKALAFAKQVGLKIIFASHLDYRLFEWEKEHPSEISSPLGVVDFLEHIANASLVITDSFHGAVFSSIYRTPFYVMPRFASGDKNSMNSRIYNLIEELNIPNRYTDTLHIDYNWRDEELNSISTNLQRLRTRGINYLERSLRA